MCDSRASEIVGILDELLVSYLRRQNYARTLAALLDESAHLKGLATFALVQHCPMAAIRSDLRGRSLEQLVDAFERATADDWRQDAAPPQLLSMAHRMQALSTELGLYLGVRSRTFCPTQRRFYGANGIAQPAAAPSERPTGGQAPHRRKAAGPRRQCEAPPPPPGAGDELGELGRHLDAIIAGRFPVEVARAINTARVDAAPLASTSAASQPTDTSFGPADELGESEWLSSLAADERLLGCLSELVDRPRAASPLVTPPPRPSAGASPSRPHHRVPTPPQPPQLDATRGDNAVPSASCSDNLANITESTDTAVACRRSIDGESTAEVGGVASTSDATVAITSETAERVSACASVCSESASTRLSSTSLIKPHTAGEKRKRKKSSSKRPKRHRQQTPSLVGCVAGCHAESVLPLLHVAMRWRAAQPDDAEPAGGKRAAAARRKPPRRPTAAAADAPLSFSPDIFTTESTPPAKKAKTSFRTGGATKATSAADSDTSAEVLLQLLDVDDGGGGGGSSRGAAGADCSMESVARYCRAEMDFELRLSPSVGAKPNVRLDDDAIRRVLLKLHPPPPPAAVHPATSA